MKFIAKLFVVHSLAIAIIAAGVAIGVAAGMGEIPTPLPRTLVRESAASGPTAEQVEASYGVAESAIEVQ